MVTSLNSIELATSMVKLGTNAATTMRFFQEINPEYAFANLVGVEIR